MVFLVLPCTLYLFLNDAEYVTLFHKTVFLNSLFVSAMCFGLM